MAQVIESSPTLSVRERDRRYQAIREGLREKGANCAIVLGSNLFYLTNGISGERMGLFPTQELPMTVVVNGRHLVDVPASVIIESQDWIEDVRAANDASQLVARIQELKLDKGAIGLANRDTPMHINGQLRKAFPDATFIDVSDVFTNVRTIKSDEEVAMLEQANRVFDAGLMAMYERVRPGMTGAQAVQYCIQGMWAAGGDLDSTVGFNFGSVAKQNPVLGDLCLTRTIQWSDMGTVTGHSEYGGYGGHSDQEISFGEPSQLHKEMFDAVLEVRDTVLKHVKPGATQKELEAVYRQACEKTGFKWSAHSQMHQYGIDVPEFPGPAFSVGDGDARNYTLAPGMLYSISPTLVAPNEAADTLLGGTSLVVTKDGYRNLTDRKVEILVVA
jgi:Xaa-Pro aminopeptidase